MNLQQQRPDFPSMRCDKGCGACCGRLIPASPKDYEAVKIYALEHGIKPQTKDRASCVFYQDGECKVYPVRPFICRLFGHGEHSMLQCPRGYNNNIPEIKIAILSRDRITSDFRLLDEMRNEI